MQDVDTPEEAVRRFQRMIKAIIKYAKSKGMKVGFSTDPTYAPANHWPDSLGITAKGHIRRAWLRHSPQPYRSGRT